MTGEIKKYKKPLTVLFIILIGILGLSVAWLHPKPSYIMGGILHSNPMYDRNVNAGI